MVELLDRWATQRKARGCCWSWTCPARWATRRRPGRGETKLDLAKQAAIEALDQFKDEDEVGLRSSPPTSAPPGPATTSTSCRSRPIGEARGELARARSRPRSHARHAAVHGRPSPPTRRARRRTTRPDQRRRAADRRRERRRRRQRRRDQLDELIARLRGGRGRATPSRSGCSRSRTARMPTWPRCAASPRPPTPRLRRQRPRDDHKVFTAVVTNF